MSLEYTKGHLHRGPECQIVLLSVITGPAPVVPVIGGDPWLG